MKRYRIYIAIAVCLLGASLQGSEQTSERETTFFSKESLASKKEWIAKNFWAIYFTTFAITNTYIMYQRSERFRTFVQSRAQDTKKFAIERVGLPLYKAYDRIKDEGLSKEDVTGLCLAGLSLYGAKKVGDHYKVWSFDPSKTRAKIDADVKRLKGHKGKLALGLCAAAVLAWVIKSGLSLTLIERFKRSLTHLQRKVISSNSTLKELVDNAHEDPAGFVDHEHFPHLDDHLDDRQKELLDRAVEKHKAENDPMSLFDDFDFEDEA